MEQQHRGTLNWIHILIGAHYSGKHCLRLAMLGRAQNLMVSFKHARWGAGEQAVAPAHRPCLLHGPHGLLTALPPGKPVPFSSSTEWQLLLVLCPLLGTCLPHSLLPFLPASHLGAGRVSTPQCNSWNVSLFQNLRMLHILSHIKGSRYVIRTCLMTGSCLLITLSPVPRTVPGSNSATAHIW